MGQNAEFILPLHPPFHREDFMAFAVAYLPSELSSVLGVLLLGVGVVQVLVESFLAGGFNYFLCSSLFGEMIQFDEHIFQMGWNHQLENKWVVFNQTLPKTNIF